MKIIRFSIFFLLFLVSTNTFAQAPYATLRGNSVAFSPDGKTLASRRRSTVELWNVTTGTLMHTLRHRSDVNSVVFSPDGKTIVSGDNVGDVRVWNATTGTLIHTLKGHIRSVYSVAFSPPDEKTLASAGYNTVELWDATTGTLIHTLKGHRRVDWIAFSPDGTLASVDDDYTVRLWDATTGTLIHTLKKRRRVDWIAFSPDGKTLAIEDFNTVERWTVELWDATTGTLMHTLRHRSDVNSVVFSPDGKTIVSGDNVGDVRVWNATTGTLIHTLKGHIGNVNNIAFSPDGKMLASGGDRTISFWDIATGTSETIDLSFSSGSFSPDLQQFAGVVGDVIHLWDFSSRVSVAPVTVVSPPIGDSFVISINIVGGKDVRGYALTINYDSSALRYASHTLGDYLPGNVFVGPTIGTPESPGNIEDINRDGVVDIKDLIWLTVDVASDDKNGSISDFDIPYYFTDNLRGTNSYSRFSFTATSPAGVGNGDGTLATVTFEVLERRASNFALSGTLSDNDGNRVPFVVSPGRVVTPPWDVNGDGSVDILDLSYVAARFGQNDQTEADVNEDGVVDIKDLIVVASGMPGAAAAPAAWQRGMESVPTRADVEQWLVQAQQLNLTDVSSQKGIFFLQSLLVALVPQETLLLPNYPNPFNPETWIPYQLAKPTDVTLTLYDIHGRVVQHLDLGHQRAGIYQNRSRAAYWDGRNAQGELVASGIYFYTLKAGDFSATRKMLIRK